MRLVVDNNWNGCPRYLPFSQLCYEYLREYRPPESRLLHSNGPFWPTYIISNSCRLSCRTATSEKKTQLHFVSSRGPQIILLNKQNVVGYCQTRRKEGKKLRGGSESRLACSAQRWVRLLGDWETSLAGRSPGGPWRSKEPRGRASWWSGTAESRGSHGSLSEETTQPLFLSRQAAIGTSWSLLPSLYAQQAFSSRYRQESALFCFSLWKISSWTPCKNEVGSTQLRTMKVITSSRCKPVVLWVQTQLIRNFMGWLHTMAALLQPPLVLLP